MTERLNKEQFQMAPNMGQVVLNSEWYYMFPPLYITNSRNILGN